VQQFGWEKDSTGRNSKGKGLCQIFNGSERERRGQAAGCGIYRKMEAGIGGERKEKMEGGRKQTGARIRLSNKEGGT